MRPLRRDETDVSGDDDLTQEARLFLWPCINKRVRASAREESLTYCAVRVHGKVLQNRHDQPPCYGKGSALDKNKWLLLADQFIDRGLVRVGEYYVLSITDFGQRVLDGEPFLGQAPTSGRRTSMSSQVRARGELQYDADLFEKLPNAAKIHRRRSQSAGIHSLP